MLEIRAIEAPHGLAPGLDLTVAAGELVAVIGPNGAGKSTMLRSMAGLLAPARGEVRLEGAPLHRMSRRAIARVMAVVSQDTALAFDFTVREAVAMGRHPFRGRFATETSTDRQAIALALEAVELEGLAGRSVLRLSGGERQRVLIARALAQTPRLLLLDEPTAHLDFTHRADLLARLRRQNRDQGLTVVVVLHDLNLAALYCDRLVLLSRGRLCADGAPEAVLTREHLEAVYGEAFEIVPHPRCGAPQILSVRS